MQRKPIFIEPPGATPIDDVSGLIPANVRTRHQLFTAEARNISKAFSRYLAATPSKRQAPFTLDWCYKLHSEMFGEVWNWAGKRRMTDLNIGVPKDQIEHDLKNLVDDLAAWQEYKSFSLIEQSVRLHHRAVKVHPFINGNGRWARLLANIWLKRFKASPVQWPEDEIGNAGTIREEYMAAIKLADQENYELLTGLHKRYSGPL